MIERDSARNRYASRLSELATNSQQLAKRNATMVIVRTIIFFLAAIMLASGYIGAEPRGTLLTIGWTAAAAFLVAITFHEHIRLTELKNRRQQRLYERLLARLDRRWDDLPASLPQLATMVLEKSPSAAPVAAKSDAGLTAASSSSSNSPLADDLDLFGSASLWQLLSMPGTGFGSQTLRRWLLTIPTWSELQERHAAVRELRDAVGPREHIIDVLATISDGADNASRLALWAQSAPWLPRHRVAHALSYIGPVCIALGSLVLASTSGASEPDTFRIWVAVSLIGAGFAINFLLTLGWGSWMHDIFLQVTGSNRDANQLSEIFRSIGELPGQSRLLVTMREQAALGEQAAVRGFAKLLWRVRMANLQRDPIFYLVYLALQLTIAWDFRVMKSLERWQQEFGSASAGWFEMLGQCEALLAAATLADEYPDWAYPEPCTQPGLVFRIQGLGHPLLPDAARVPNDVSLERAQPLLLVTGSNMAGKSTLLRSLGLNQMLARTGAPVCATRYESPLFELATSIRVRDSLKDGVSFFMAELKRLKQVVDIAEHAHQHSGQEPPVMFLLDEILQGTNSRERQIAVMKVLEGLLQREAVGAISTHDLELADQAAILAVSQVVHFREMFEQDGDSERMRFDYQMRPGPTPTTNALKLLKLVGL